MSSRSYFDEITTDPTTGQELVFSASSEAELDAQIAEYFGPEDHD